jgi:ABC-2 type transport system permease protein
MLGRILSLIIKEILAVWRDKKSRLSLVVPPIIQLFIFAWAATLDVKNVSIGILNLDYGQQAYELTQRFQGSPVFDKITYLKSATEIAPFIDAQKGLMVVYIDEPFSRNLKAQKETDIQLILDGRKSNTTQILLGYASAIIDQYNKDFSSEAGITTRPSVIVPRNWFNPNLLYYWYNIPCLCGILSMLTSLTVTALSVAREKELGTFDQLLVSPMLPIEIVIGKALPAILIGLAEGSIIIFAGVVIFKIPFTGSLLMLYFSMLVFVCSIVGVGLFISSLCSTQQQAILGTFVFISPSVSLSGFATPIENMPVWLQYLTYANPLRYFLVISKGIFLKEMPPSIALSNTWQMALVAVFTLSAATWLFRKRLE